MPDQTPQPLTRKPAPFSDRELTEYANGTVTASNPYAAVQDLATELIDARGWARHGYEIGQRSCAWSDHGVAPAWLIEGHTPESLEPTEDQRRLFGLDEENARLRARIAELEKAQANPDAYIAVKRCGDFPNADRPDWFADARVLHPGAPHFEADRAEYVRNGFDLLPIVGTETGTRPAAPARCQATTTGVSLNDPWRCIWCELPNGHAGSHHGTIPQPGYQDATVDWPASPPPTPAGYVVVTRNPEGGLHRSATVWESLDQARAAEGVQAGYADGTGCTAAVYALQEVQQ